MAQVERIGHALVVFILCVGINYCSGVPFTTGSPEEKENNTCIANNYCLGEKFLPKYIMDDHFIQCDFVPNPKDMCCLPEEKHMVCYNIMVDGKYLNFDQTSPSKATDFKALCDALVRSLNKVPGKYAKVTLDTNRGGYIRYNYGAFSDLLEPSEKSIKDLACGLGGTWPGKAKPLPRRTTTTTVPSPVPQPESDDNVEVNVQN